MLKTKLTGEEIPEIDSTIINWIEKNTFKDKGHNMIIGIENKKNKVYRNIEVTGFNDFIDVMEFLSSLDMMDITDIPYAPKKGYDGRFRFVDQIKLGEFSHKSVTRND